MKAQHRQKTWYDSKSKERRFKEGDLVLVLLPTSHNKLKAEWKGPYQVCKQIGPVDYQIDTGRETKDIPCQHVKSMAQCTGYQLYVGGTGRG